MNAQRLTATLAAFSIAGILLSPPALCSNRDALRQIVQEECVVHWQQQHNASPCERMGSGFAVLADRKGGAHFLLIPTRTLAGIESPEVLEPGAPNYFDAAWQARDRIAAVVGHEVPRSAVGLAVNPKHSRSQDQMHIHIECLRADVAASLRAASTGLSGAWSSIEVVGWRFDALRILGENLGTSNPIRLLADRMPDSPARREEYSLLVAGMQYPEGPGFVVLMGTALPGELLLDSTCAVA
ncbi:MAG TPA: CDP-diacylglycerol diphosphatase [Steroidobacteraceae bacterium]|jgi:CDP-diacylglycerol pyrophosphatase|nr:CDP-diacylglycerol diphosphatase [Steroidobacteraceae bacterium]